LAAILRGRRLNSRIAFQATVGGSERFALILDFNLLPRLAPPKKSMEETDLNPASAFRRAASDPTQRGDALEPAK
jgi:hypothetical protein